MAFRLSSLRARLFVSYTGLILLGFGGLTLLAGSQVSTVARAEFEQSLMREVELIAHGVSDTLTNTTDSTIEEADVEAAIALYADQTEGELSFKAGDRRHGDSSEGEPPATRPEGRGPGGGPPDDNPPNGDGGNNGRTEIERRDGLLITSAPIFVFNRTLGTLQLSVPESELRNAVLASWAELGSGVFVLGVLSILTSVWLSNTLIRPLKALRQSAVQVSQGDFSQRIAYSGIDEISELVGAFNEMAHQVESMLEEQRAFASNTAHELRTPLTTILLRTEALRDRPNINPQIQQQFIAQIDDEVKRLSRLVTDLTLLSRLDAGRAELGTEEINFIRFAEQLQQQMMELAHQQNIDVHLTILSSPIMIHTSLTHLTVLFRNLLDNAIKYSGPDTQIDWRIESDGQCVRCQIIDQGRGISAEHVPHLFERFYRADKARSRQIPGTGLGLALVKSIVEVYKGEIRIESAGQDEGTTVSVSLPLTTDVKTA